MQNIWLKVRNIMSKKWGFSSMGITAFTTRFFYVVATTLMHNKVEKSSYKNVQSGLKFQSVFISGIFILHQEPEE